MNERIRQLAHAAGLPTYNPEGIPTKLEKFAELIVQECVATLGTYEETWSHEKQMELLKKYFGVDNEKDTGQS